MANRQTLHLNHLDNLDYFMQEKGYMKLETKGIYEARRYKNNGLSGKLKTVIIFKRDNQSQHCTVTDNHMPIIKEFLNINEANKNLEKLPKAKIGEVETCDNPIFYGEKTILSVGGRKNGKRVEKLIELDNNIREGNFPILVLRKPQEAVIISLEEYKILKEYAKTWNTILDDIGFMKIEFGSKEEIEELLITSMKKVLTAKKYDNEMIGRKNK